MNGLLPLPRLKPRWQHRKAKAEEEASFDSCSNSMAHHEINSLSLCLNQKKQSAGIDNANRGADKTAAPEARQGPFPHRPKREWLTRGPWDLNHRSGRHEFICTKALVDQLHGHKIFLNS